MILKRGVRAESSDLRFDFLALFFDLVLAKKTLYGTVFDIKYEKTKSMSLLFKQDLILQVTAVLIL